MLTNGDATAHKATRFASLARVALLPLALALSACARLPPNIDRTESHALSDNSDTALHALVAASPPPAGSARSASGFRMLGRSESAYGSRMALIDAAQKTLDLQYYSIHYDPSTEELLSKLRSAARRGVRVRVLLDDFNAGGRNAPVLQLDDEPNIEMRMFNPLAGPRNSQFGRIVTSLFDFRRVQRRMHNKVLISDNVLAIAGGRNLGDEYFGQGEKSNFLDLDVLVAGPLVQDLSRSFDLYWQDDMAYPVRTLQAQEKLSTTPASLIPTADAPQPPETSAETGESSPPLRAAALLRAANPGIVPGAETVADDILEGQLNLVWAPSTLLVDKPSKIGAEYPEDDGETVIDGLLTLMTRVQHDLLIVSPYFVPGDRMMDVFHAMRARGVRIRVLTNSLASNDAPLAHVGYARYRRQLLNEGIELYELPATGETRRRVFGSTAASRASLHSKALVIDNTWLVIGSMNLDLRSALQNTEIGMVIRSRTLAKKLSASVEQTLQDSYQVELIDGAMRWLLPAREPFRNAATLLVGEPDASFSLQLMLWLIGPLAPEELL